MIKILTSGFSNGFPNEFSNILKKYIKEDMNFVFIASEFKNIYEKTDWYCNHFLNMFSDCGITFKNINVIDYRISKETAKELIKNADIIWLAGGDTPKQFSYLESYGLVQAIKEQSCIVIGMSAGAINMCKKAICTLTCEHEEQKIYDGIGLVEFSVEPHFNKENITEELLLISESYPLYGLCDDSFIICNEDETLYIGDIFFINNRSITRV